MIQLIRSVMLTLIILKKRRINVAGFSATISAVFTRTSDAIPRTIAEIRPMRMAVVSTC